MRVLPDALLFDSFHYGSTLGCRTRFRLIARPQTGPVQDKISTFRFRLLSLPLHAGAAIRLQSAPATPPVFSRFQPFNLWENATAASRAGAVTPLHPVARIYSARPLLFSDDALSFVSLRCAFICFEPGPANEVACSAASLLSPSHRVARVSRLIGKFDTTLKAVPWQVAERGRSWFAT
jgi:hypothetical protein